MSPPPRRARSSLLSPWSFALILGLALISCTAGSLQRESAAQSPVIALRFADDRSPASPTTKAALDFAERAGRNSGGRIDVRVSTNGKLGDEASVVEQLRFGGIDLARLVLPSLAELSPSARAAALPGAFPDAAAAELAFSGEVGERIAAELAGEKIVVLAWLPSGPMCVANSRRRAAVVGDLSGLKIGVRSSRSMVDLLTAAALDAVPLDPRDVHRSLVNRFADGIYDSLVACAAERYCTEAPFVTVFDYAAAPELIAASRPTFMRLSKPERSIIEEAAKEASDSWRAELQAAIESAYAALERDGAAVTEARGDALVSAGRSLRAVEPDSGPGRVK